MSFLDELNEGIMEKLETVSDVFVESSKSVISMLIGSDVDMSRTEMKPMTLDEISALGIDNAVVTSASFSKKYEGSLYFVLNVNDATILVDLMLGGEGNASDDIEEDGLDAVSETANQIMGASCQTFSENAGETVSFENVFARKIKMNEMSDDEKEFLTGDRFFTVQYNLKIDGILEGKMIQMLTEETAESVSQSHDVEEEVEVPVPQVEVEVPSVQQPAVSQPAFSQSSSAAAVGGNIDLLLDIELPVVVRMGQTEIPLAEILKLAPGSLIELDKNADDPIDLLINNKKIAKGEVVIVDGNFALRITEISSKAERIKSLG